MGGSRLRPCLFLVAASLFIAADFCHADGSNVIESFTIAKGGAPILLPVEIQGEKHLFVLDSGSTHTMFDTSLVHGKYVRTVNAGTVHGMTRLKLFQPPRASLGKFSLCGSEPVPGLDLTKVREISDEPIYGIIGMDFLIKHVIHIDFDRGDLSFVVSADKESRIPVDCPVVDGHPMVRARLTAVGGYQFIADTGYTGGVTLEEDLFNGLLTKSEFKQHELKLVQRHLSTDVTGRTIVRWTGRGAGISIDPFTVNRVLVDRGRLNLLGLGYWSRFNIIWDFPARKMYLREGTAFGLLDLLDLSGLHVFRRDGKIVVRWVRPHSVAKKAGIEPWDIIVQVGDKPASQIKVADLRRTCCQKGTKLQMIIERDGSKQDVVLDLE